MNNDLKKIIREAKRLFVTVITVQLLCCHSVNVAWAAEYASLIDAIQATTTPRTYTLDGNETSPTVLGNIEGWKSVLTIDGGVGNNYGINNTSTAPDTRLFVNKNQTLYLKNLGTYTKTTSSSIVAGLDIITGITVVNSVNNFGLTSDRVGFLRSAGTSHITNSVFYNNRGKFGAAVQNRENGTMSIIDSVFAANNSPQGAVHNDSVNGISDISNSIFYNNTATTQAVGDTDLKDRSASAIYNKPVATINSISGSQFVGNNTISTVAGQQTGTIYNAGTINTIINSVFYNNTNQNGSVINNISGSMIENLVDSAFVQNTAEGSGAAILNASGSTIDTITGSNFISNTATSDGGAIYNEGTITNLGGTYASNSAVFGGALYNDGTITNAINATFGGDNVADGNSADKGGAIYNAADRTLSVASTSIFKNNTATSDGGAIYNAGTANNLAGTYNSNTAANGGAIYNAGTISDLAGTYTSNSATANGGAIYNAGTVTVTSSNGANTTFSGNQANGISNALYNSGTVNMNAGANSSITFDDKITGSNGAIALGGEGIVELNDTVSGNSVVLNSGTLKLGTADSIQGTTSFIANGGLLDLRNDATENYQLGQNTIINGTVDLAIDADLAGTTPVSDIISAKDAGSVSGTGGFVFSSANINLMSYATKVPLWIQVTDEYLRNNAGLGGNANITITGPESYLVTYETSHDSVNAGFLKLEHGTLENAIASTITEKAYTMGNDEELTSTPALGGTSLTVNGNTAGYSITGDAGTGIAVGDGQTLSLNNIGVDSTGNVTGAGFNNFSTALTNAGNGTINLYNTKLSGNTTDIDNEGVVNMSGTVILDNAQGTGSVNITKDTGGNASSVTVNNSLEQDNITIASDNTLTNNNATITANANLNNAGTITGTGASSLVINGDSVNTGTIEQGTVTTAASVTLANNGTVIVNDTLDNNGSIVGDSGVLNINATTTNAGVIEQGTLVAGNGITLTNTGDITVKTTLANNGTVLNNGSISVAGGSNAGSITGNGAFVNTGDFANNDYIEQDTVTNGGTITTNSENLVAASGIANNGTLVYNAGSQTVSDITGDGSANSHVELRVNAPFVIDNTISNTYIDLYNSTLRFGNSGDISGATAFNVNGGAMDLIDGSITSTDLGTVNLNAQSDIGIDLDLSTLTSDSFNATVNNNGGIFNISQVNLLGTTTQDNINIHLGDMTQLGQANVTSATIELPSVMTPIRKINGRIENGWLTYGGSGSDLSDFNPAVLATPVVAQAGMQTIMANTFQHAYEHADWYTKFPANERFSMPHENPDAINHIAKGENYDKSSLSGQDKDRLAIWFKSYAAFEDVPLRQGPKAEVNSYGSLVGIDSNFQDWGRDWYGVTTGYVGYNGAKTDYPEVSSSMDGGLFGLTQTFYKNNFWTGVTANVGASFVNTRTMYGRENSTLFATGLGTQTGYNIELGGGDFIVQPIWLMNYSMIKTFDYTNAAGVKIAPKPLHTVQLNPTLRLIGNVKGWQPYASVGMVWNFMDKTDVTANSVKLPEMSIKPYVRYDVGVQKAIGNRFTGFIQAMGYSGGRDGIDVVGGIRWAFGKGGKSPETVKENDNVGNAVDSSNMQKSETEKPVVSAQEIQVEQEPVKIDQPVVNVPQTGKPQQRNNNVTLAVNTQKIDKDQKDAQPTELAATVHQVNQGQTDTPAAETVTNVSDEKDGQRDVQSEDPEEQPQESNHLAMAITIGAILLLLALLLARKRK